MCNLRFAKALSMQSANSVVEFLQSLQQNVPVGHETERRLSQVRVADAVNHEFLAIGSYVIRRRKEGIGSKSHWEEPAWPSHLDFATRAGDSDGHDFVASAVEVQFAPVSAPARRGASSGGDLQFWPGPRKRRPAGKEFRKYRVSCQRSEPQLGWIISPEVPQLASLARVSLCFIPSHAAIHCQARAPVSRVEHL